MASKPVPRLNDQRQECCDHPDRVADQGNTAKSEGLLWLWYNCKACGSGIWLWVRFLTDDESDG